MLFLTTNALLRKELQRGFAVPVLCDVAFQHLALMIHGPPKGMRLAADLHENLVQVPSPIRVRTHLLDTFTTNFCGEHWAKSIPPIPHRFVADVDAALVQQVLDIAERKGKANLHHDRQADDLRVAVKALERVCFRHEQRLRNHPARLKQICSDNAIWFIVW
jgi:hypothetical protein